MRHIASRPVARGATRQSEVREDARVLFPLDFVAPMTNRPRPYRSPGRLYCNRLPLREAFMRMGALRRMGYSRESGNPERNWIPGQARNDKLPETYVVMYNNTLDSIL